MHALPEAAARLLTGRPSRESAPSAVPRSVKGGRGGVGHVSSPLHVESSLCANENPAKDDGSVDVDGPTPGDFAEDLRNVSHPACVRTPRLYSVMRRVSANARRRSPRTSGWAIRIKASARWRRLSEQIHNAVFGDDPVNMSTRGHHQRRVSAMARFG